MSGLERAIQLPAVGDALSLFRFDATSVGGGILFLTPGAFETTGVHFGGVYYTPVDVEFTDFETNGTGSLPTPKMRISNINHVIQDLVNTYGDMLGCEVRRVRTFAQFLDGAPEADGSAFIGPDVFRVERKASENPIFVEWELSASIDQEGKMLPGRVVVRDACLKRYRRYNPATGDFDYSKATCPYAGVNCFTNRGQPTADRSKDSCGRRLSDCQLRFGTNADLPFGGFPGATRIRI